MSAPSIETILALVDEPARGRCRAIYEAHRERIEAAPGSSHNHQAWPGGYVGHLDELARIAAATYAGLAAIRPLPFSLADAAVVLFLHDLEKPWHHVEPKLGLKGEGGEKGFVLGAAVAVGLELTPEQRNALEYVHGEGDDYRRDARVQLPLGAFCHACDVISARIWHDHPRPESV